MSRGHVLNQACLKDPLPLEDGPLMVSITGSRLPPFHRFSRLGSWGRSCRLITSPRGTTTAKTTIRTRSAKVLPRERAVSTTTAPTSPAQRPPPHPHTPTQPTWKNEPQKPTSSAPTPPPSSTSSTLSARTSPSRPPASSTYPCPPRSAPPSPSSTTSRAR